MDTNPKILSLNPIELIDWCNMRKKEMGLSNAKLAELSNVPLGTIDRIFTKKNPEFRYSTIQPIVAILIEVNEQTPTNESEKYYFNTIEGYKLVLKNKNHEIDELKNNYESLRKDIAYLKQTNVDQRQIIEELQAHTKWLEKLIDKQG